MTGSEKKRDRLAVVREKRKRYGLKKLSKEENQRLKTRTEERLEVARAKENLWKRFRGDEEDREMVEDKIKAWESLREGIMELEEEGVWRNPGKEVRTLVIRGGKLECKDQENDKREDPHVREMGGIRDEKVDVPEK